jgi:hypothetical protein
MSTVPKIFKSDHAYIRLSLRLATEAIASGDWATARDIYQEIGAIGATLETLADDMVDAELSEILDK